MLDGTHLRRISRQPDEFKVFSFSSELVNVLSDELCTMVRSSVHEHHKDLVFWIEFDNFVHEFAVCLSIGGIFFDAYQFSLVIDASEDRSSDMWVPISFYSRLFVLRANNAE